jgi:O-antigen/teichoic acid export membrane protein
VNESKRGSAFSGARWSAAGKAVQRSIRFLLNVVLARVLFPSDFGLFAVASTVMGIMDQIRDLGTGQAIIQKKEISQRLLSSLFWMNLLIGLSCAAVLVLAAPVIAGLFKTPEVTDILRVMGIGFSVYSWSITQRALLTRKLDFRRLAASDLIGSFTNATVGVTLALMGWGVWSLAISYVCSGITGTIALWALAGWRPSFEFSRADLREVRGFSMNLTAYNIANNLLTNADNIIISRFLGAEALGVYSLGRRLVVFPVRSIAAIVAGVLLPALSRVQDDLPRLQRDYLRAAAGFSMIALPMAAGIACVAGPLVEVVLGPRWLAAKPVVEMLAPTMRALGPLRRRDRLPRLDVDPDPLGARDPAPPDPADRARLRPLAGAVPDRRRADVRGDDRDAIGARGAPRAGGRGPRRVRRGGRRDLRGGPLALRAGCARRPRPRRGLLAP